MKRRLARFARITLACSVLVISQVSKADVDVSISAVSVPQPATYGVGAELEFGVTFNDTVTVDTSAGVPMITLTVGTARRSAYYTSGSGSQVLVFSYKVEPGANDGNGLAMGSSILLADGVITSGSTPVETSFTPPDTSGLIIDTPPIVTAIRRLSPTSTATAAGTLTWRVSFSESVTGVDATDFRLLKTQGAYGAIDAVNMVNGSNYDVVIGNVSGNGTLRLDVNASGTGIIAGTHALETGFTAGQIYAPLTASVPVAWGRNVNGRLGDGTTTERTVPTAIKTDDQLAGRYIVELAAGAAHSLGLTADGRVYGWGFNENGELGLGTYVNRVAPQPVKIDGVLAGKTIVAIAAGGRHSLAVDSNGKVYSWGGNDLGQLGNGSNTDSNVPVAVSTSGVLSGKTVVAVAAGDDFSLALDSDGRVYAWGNGSDGQLGNGGYQDSNVPVAVATNAALSGKTVIAIAAGSEHVLALTSEGKAYSWGSNTNGQLGLNRYGTDQSSPQPIYHAENYGTKTIVAIAAGWDHSIVLTSEGRIYVWGENDHGQAGNDATANRNDPVSPVTTSGVLGGKNIVAVNGGDSHTVALSADGKVFNWGFNDYGQLGNGTSDTDLKLPVAVSTDAVLADKTVVALGNGSLGVFNLALSFATTGPRVVAVSVAANSYRTDDTLDITVKFNNPVTVTGTPKLGLTIGTTDYSASYASGSGTDTLVFSYTVEAGQLDLDGIALASTLTLNGGSIADSADLDAVLAFTPPSTDTVLVDTRPHVTAFTPADGATSANPASALQLGFSSAVTAVAGKKVVIHQASDDAIVASIDVGDTTQVTVSGANVTIQPASALLYNTNYYVKIDAGAFRNSLDQDFAGISTTSDWNFGTEIRANVTAADSSAFASYFANTHVSVINLVPATTYVFPGGTVSRTLKIEGNGATLQAGAGVTDDVIRSGTAGGVTLTGLGDYTNQKVFLKVGAALTLNNLTLQNNGANALSNGLFTVINVKNGGSLTADRLTLKDFHNNPTPGTALAFGIHTEPLAAALTLTNSTIGSSNAFRNAIAVRGGTITATGNAFTGTVYPERLRNSDGYEYAFYLYGGNGTVSDNTISGYDSTTQPGYGSSAISVIGFYNAEYTIEDNVLSGNSLGIDVTRQWSPYSSPAPTMQINGTVLQTSDDAFTIGEALRSANDEDDVSVSLDQNDEVEVGSDSTYFTVLGGYRSPFLTASNETQSSVTLQFPSSEIDVLTAATAIAVEEWYAGSGGWVEVTPTWTGIPDTVVVELPALASKFRAKLTHTSYVETGDPTPRTLVTYSAAVAVNVATEEPAGPTVIDEFTPNDGVINDPIITSGGIVDGGTLAGVIQNAGIIRNVQLAERSVVDGGTLSGEIRGDADAPARIDNARIAQGSYLENVVIQDGTTLASGIVLGPNVKFEGTANIPGGLDLTGALRRLNWADGDLRGVVDLGDDVQAPVGGVDPMSLIRSIQLLQDYEPAGNDVSQTSNGEILVITADSSSALVPVQVSMALPGEEPGTYINADGDVVFVTVNRRVVLSHPALLDKPGFETLIAAFGLDLSYDDRANLIATPASTSTPALTDGRRMQALTEAEHYFSARPGVLALPAPAGAVPGALYESVEGLRLASKVSFLFVDEKTGDLMQQAIVPVPVDWPQLKTTLESIGYSEVHIDLQGIIHVNVDGVAMKGRSTFRVTRDSAALAVPGRVVFTPAGDVNGDGRADVMMIFPNGDRQQLLIFPQAP